MRSRPLAAALFAAFFALYLFSMGPSLAAYRDAGEMAVSAHSLGVSHPPSYPLYNLLGRLAAAFPLGNRAYALNLLSAAAGAAAPAALCAALAPRFGPAAALAGALALGLNATFWSLATVQEMYSLSALLAVLLLGTAQRLSDRFEPRLWYGAVFAGGVFLGNRTDLLLWAPGLLWLAAPRALTRASGAVRRRFLLLSAAAFACGLSVYLYLPLRSLRGPWLDWNHPASLANLWGSITRRGYGGTLDLLSKNYAPGAMFLPNLEVYAGHLWRSLWAPGLLLAALGCARGAGSDRRRWLGEAALYAASGPGFLFLANLPPNPHAMAIVEPHYLLSDVILSVWIARGAAALAALPWAPALAAATLAAQPWLLGRWRGQDRRWDLVCHDFVQNTWRSTPPGSLLVAKKDVQLFSLWYYRRVAGQRPDLEVVPQGLAHSPWYQDSQRRFGVGTRLRHLKDAEGWRALLGENERPVYAALDAEFHPGVEPGPPRGLVVPLRPAGEPSAEPWRFLVRRGDYRAERRPEFFTEDLVSAYAAARQGLGAALVKAGRLDEGRRELIGAWAMKRRQPEAANFLGYLELQSGRLAAAAGAYEHADRLYGELLELTREYHSLPETAAAISAAAADARLNLGVVYEKLARAPEAERAYLRALEANPKAARARFNLAVLYWGKDWPRAARELEAALAIDPGYEEARKYLLIARQAQAAPRRP